MSESTLKPSESGKTAVKIAPFLLSLQQRLDRGDELTEAEILAIKEKRKRVDTLVDSVAHFEAVRNFPKMEGPIFELRSPYHIPAVGQHHRKLEAAARDFNSAVDEKVQQLVQVRSHIFL